MMPEAETNGTQIYVYAIGKSLNNIPLWVKLGGFKLLLIFGYPDLLRLMAKTIKDIPH